MNSAVTTSPESTALPAKNSAEFMPITVTVQDNATIFDGPANLYRYDLPGSGIVEGWALLAVVEQIRQLSPTAWPEVEVVVDAAPDIADILIRTLVNKGAAAYPADLVLETSSATGPLPEVSSDPFSALRHQKGRKTPAQFSLKELLSWRPERGHLLIIVVALIGGTIAFWSISRSTGGSANNPDSLIVSAQEKNSLKSTPDSQSPAEAAKSAPTLVATPSLNSPPTSVPESKEIEIQDGGLYLKAPPGFKLHREPDFWILSGTDDSLRIRLAADLLPGENLTRVLSNIRDTIQTDPQLELLKSDAALGKPAGISSEVVAYRELPGDGSQYHWVTWLKDGYQLSVGCHSRSIPTANQRAICRTVVESVTFKPPGTDSA
ncbi:type VII secretion-associated protein [Corynebacterium caspium]|uniref:type VII secretion-associated protein n=1 Tax=Corynebacterium caspium TaxID=234828 RepID=UPI000368569F|nr:type VII secretion-associated protein [Corynebacterium caspium]WKD59808.1 hypothetical protein CCASP_07145 [Corynebacterium caspium DSM 44850]